jgi:hypothetical protein
MFFINLDQNIFALTFFWLHIPIRNVDHATGTSSLCGTEAVLEKKLVIIWPFLKVICLSLCTQSSDLLRSISVTPRQDLGPTLSPV